MRGEMQLWRWNILDFSGCLPILNLWDSYSGFLNLISQIDFVTELNWNRPYPYVSVHIMLSLIRHVFLLVKSEVILEEKKKVLYVCTCIFTCMNTPSCLCFSNKNFSTRENCGCCGYPYRVLSLNNGWKCKKYKLIFRYSLPKLQSEVYVQSESHLRGRLKILLTWWQEQV